MVVATPAEPGTLLPPLRSSSIETAGHRPALRPARGDRRRPEHRRRQGIQAAARRAMGVGARLALDRVPPRSDAHAGTTASRCARATCATASTSSRIRRSARRRRRSSRTSTPSRCATRSPRSRTSSGTRRSSSTIWSTRSRSCPSTSSATRRRRSSRRPRSRGAGSGRGASVSRAGSRASASSSSPTPRTIAAGRSSTASCSPSSPDFNARRRALLRRRRGLLRAAPPRAHRQARERHGAARRPRIRRCSTRIWRSTSSTRSSPRQPHPIFGDRAVRRALTMAVDRRAMLRNVFGTLGMPSYGPFPRSLPVADTTLPQLPYDTLKARALLDSAGWIVGPDGVRVKNGQRLEFSITTPSSSAARKQYAVLLQDAFKRSARRVKIDETDFASFVAKLQGRTFDTEIDAYGTDPSVVRLQADVELRRRSGRTARTIRRTESDRRRAARQRDATPSIRRARARTHVARSRSIIEDAPGIWLYEPPTVAGIHKRIHTTDDARRRVLGGDGRLVDPGRRAHARGTGSVSDPRRRRVRRFLAGRLAQAAIVVLLVTTVTFVARPPRARRPDRDRARSARRHRGGAAAVARGVRPRPPARRAVRALARATPRAASSAGRSRSAGPCATSSPTRCRARCCSSASRSCSASRSASSSRVLQAERPGGRARPLARSHAAPAVLGARLLAGARRAAALRVSAPALSAERDRRSRDARLHVARGRAARSAAASRPPGRRRSRCSPTAAISRHQRSALLEVHAERLDAHRDRQGAEPAPRRAATRAAQRTPAHRSRSPDSICPRSRRARCSSRRCSAGPAWGLLAVERHRRARLSARHRGGARHERRRRARRAARRRRGGRRRSAHPGELTWPSSEPVASIVGPRRLLARLLRDSRDAHRDSSCC